MGLDVYLYQFKDVDPDAILALARFEEGLMDEEFPKTTASPPSDRGGHLSKDMRSEIRAKTSHKARELGLPGSVVKAPQYGGTRISIQSQKHPNWGNDPWVCFGSVRSLMQLVTGKTIYFVFPEAEGNAHWLQPDWAAARQRFSEILEQIKTTKPADIERLDMGASNCLNAHLMQMEVMLETLDFVLSHENPKQFLLYWSN